MEPLRGSIVLEQIDLSLVGRHDSPDVKPDPSISELSVLPILNSIICAGGNSIKHIFLPQLWRENQSSSLDQFLFRYNLLLQTHGFICSRTGCGIHLNSRTSLGWTTQCPIGEKGTVYKIVPATIALITCAMIVAKVKMQ